MNKILFYTRIRQTMPLVLATVLTLVTIQATLASPSVNPAKLSAELEEAEVLTRMENMGCLIPVKLTKEVKDQIYRYTESYKKGSGEILGRAEMYFPIFDQYLTEAGIPSQLKYLSIVESALRPDAVSSAGAAGLWQFMRETGRYYGLEINRNVDQRRDPHLSTQSAVKYLKDLYDTFGDWSLALAAYNSGPGRVREAIRQANSTDFWKIKNYLPKETRNYVPAFIAASYLVSYYYMHGIEPILVEDDLVFTSSIMVYEKISFEDIASWTKLPIEKIRKLNPAYLKNYIPENESGHYLVLPNHSIHQVVNHLKRPDQARWVGIMPAFTPAIDENILENPVESTNVITFQKSEITMMAQLEPLVTLETLSLPAFQITPVNPSEREIRIRKEPARSEEGMSFIYYRLRKGQSLSEVAELKGVEMEELLSWNENLTAPNKNMTGTYIRIPAME